MRTHNRRERRVRYRASRQGYMLHKLHNADDRYWLIDAGTNFLVLGHQITRGVDIGCTLAAVEDWLNG
jgi:hypothetical protein